MKNAVKNIWSEIRTTYTEDDTQITKVDAWVTGDDNEEGNVIAEIDVDGNVKYLDERAKTDKNAQEEIKAKIAELGEAKQELIDKVIEEIKSDIAKGDVTAIDELLKFCPTKNLQAYLPE